MVEKANTRLKSVCTRAIDAAKIAEIPPIQATTWKASGSAAANMNQVRPTIYTPAATIVAAWISALTGVGPSMAGGNHTCKDNHKHGKSEERKIGEETSVPR